MLNECDRLGLDSQIKFSNYDEHAQQISIFFVFYSFFNQSYWLLMPSLRTDVARMQTTAHKSIRNFYVHHSHTHVKYSQTRWFTNWSLKN